MKRATNKGFTLVELIVVIAILGILAGVGTVAYTGYIERANKATDDQLIAEIEYALSLGRYQDAGCDGTVTVYHVSQNKDAEAAGKEETPDETVEGWMAAAFGGEWKALRLKYYDKYPFPAYDASLTAEQIAMVTQFKTSNLHKGIDSMPGLTAKLSRSLATVLPGVAQRDSKSVLDVLKSRSTVTDEELAAYGIDENSTEQELANFTVLLMAKQISEMDVLKEASIMMGDYSRTTKADMKAGTSKDLYNATLIYATYAAYANSGEASEEYKNYFNSTTPQSLTDVYSMAPATSNLQEGEWINKEERDKFDVYTGGYSDGRSVTFTDEQVQASQVYNDLLALQNAMKILTDKESQFDVSDPTTFDNETTVALMNAILAQG